MEVIKTKKQKKSLLLRFAVLAFAVYALALLIQQQVTIREKKQELDSVKQQLQIQEIQNDDLKNAVGSGNASSGYIEEAAREGLDFSKPGERVFVNIAGK